MARRWDSQENNPDISTVENMLLDWRYHVDRGIRNHDQEILTKHLGGGGCAEAGIAWLTHLGVYTPGSTYDKAYSQAIDHPERFLAWMTMRRLGVVT